MTRSETESALLELFTETGGAHHQAFIASDEADENRALGYATYLRSRRQTAAGVDQVEQDLVVWLLSAEPERSTWASEALWSEFYARDLVAARERASVRCSDAPPARAIDGCPSRRTSSAISKHG